jgi:Fe-S-cluster-containing hydrogenase component 2
MVENMKKIIVKDFEKCIGCRTCETICSLSHEERVNPVEARIAVAKYEESGWNIPTLCQKCEDPVCVAVCPTKSIKIDPALGPEIDYSRCIGCRLCIMACPIGGVGLNPISRKTVMCDLCGGDPKCVKVCTTQALEYQEDENLSIEKRGENVGRLMKFLQGVNQ